MTQIFYRVTVGFIHEDGEDDGTISIQQAFRHTDGSVPDFVQFIDGLLKNPTNYAMMLNAIRAAHEGASELVTPDEDAA
ncbi:MAG: hypothetical protein ABF979_05670 [Gluconobacter sp.]|uniref:hypothetical protein n=1 Tax=Gluconobacter sp. TaxID=1876758 RepID=UPI0039E9285C